MTTNKFVELLQALRAGTAANRVSWQDLPDEDMFRTHVGGGMVRIGKTDTAGQKGYKLWLLAPGGAIAGELELYAGEPHFDLIEDVYMAARLAARGGNHLIDIIIRELTPQPTIR